MQERRMIAEVGCMLKVIGRRMATAFGPPSPGSTPTTIPRRIPISIRPRLYQLSATVNPCRRWTRSTIELVTEESFQRPLGHRDGELDLEDPEEERAAQHPGERALPHRVLPEDLHEGGDEEGRGDVHPGELDQRDVDHHRNGDLEDGLELIPADEGQLLRHSQGLYSDAHAAQPQQHSHPHREVTRLRAIPGPAST